MTTPRWLAALDATVDARIRAAMAAVDRDAFLPAEARAQRDDDVAIPLANGQTISQPSLVARMLDLLAVEPGHSVLDVGAGSGYVAALLRILVGPQGRVVAVERQADLIHAAQRALTTAQIQVDLRHGDGLRGAPDAAPFARIHCGCASARIPRALLDQLTPTGRMVLPLGPLVADQVVTVVQRRGHDMISSSHDPVRFVPALPGLIGVVGDALNANAQTAFDGQGHP